MGQKINPTGFRLSVNRNWGSKWYASSKNFPAMLAEDIKVREYLKKKLSHAADSQDQRHRMTPAARPLLAAVVDGEPDVVVPRLVAHAGGEAERVFAEAVARAWEGAADTRRLGASAEAATYLLPNALAIRLVESADLLNLHHKHRMRLCYNAQEEIWQACLDEALQIRATEPEIGRWLLPPCAVRQLAGRRPFCPEGDRFCGIPVWRMQPADYTRVI